MDLIQKILQSLRAKKTAHPGGLPLSDRMRWQPRWTIHKYRGNIAPENLYAVEDIDGNLLLNVGITEMLNLLIGGAATAFSAANARLGVGDSTTAASAAQTGLQAATNKAYRSMDAGYPQVSGQTVTFKSTFGGTDANYAWQEFVADNGAGKTLNRKVEAHGTKSSGDSWVLTLTVTLS